MESNTQKEQEFLNSFDCSFPYKETVKAKMIIDQAINLSDNAVFCVVYEIIYVPRDIKIAKFTRIDLLKYICEQHQNKLLDFLLPPLLKKINWKTIRAEEVLSYMDICKEYAFQYAALNIIYFLSYDDTGEIEEKYEEVKSDWDKLQFDQ